MTTAGILLPLAILLGLAPRPPAAEPTKPQAGQAADPKTRLAAKIEKYRKKYGADMLVDVDAQLKILFVMGTDQRTLAEVKQRLTAHAAALQRDLFKHGLQDYLSVIVPGKWANPKVTGHFYPDWVDAATVGSNLMHEFTHALHYADQTGRGEYQPVWIMEGFASMYEDSKVVDGHAVPLVNHRLLELQDEVRGKKHLPFGKMMKLERRQFTSHHYAQARYMCVWLHATGKLDQWYADYIAGFAQDQSGIAAMERVCGKKLEELEKDWVKWLLALEPPKLVLGPGAASLGIATRQLPDAVEIVQVLPGAAADQAGLAAGDALIRLGGERVVEIEDLVVALASRKVGDTVQIEFRRGGNYAATAAKLTPLPEAAPVKPEP